MKIYKSIFSFICCTMLCISMTCVPVAATSDLSDYNTDSSTGWNFKVNKDHRGSKYNLYTFASTDIKSLYSSDLSSAISLWGSKISMAETTQSGYGVITTMNKPTSDTIASAQVNCYVSNAHSVNDFTITINTALYDSYSTTMKKKILAHEIGHLYGLGHFNDTSKIMNPTAATTMAITSTDLYGMDVCTHNHTHTSTTYYSYSRYSGTQHIARCSTCKAFIYQNHSLNGSVCTKCGYPYAKSIDDYEDFDEQDNDNVEVDDMPQDEFEYEDDMTDIYDTPFVYYEN